MGRLFFTLVMSVPQKSLKKRLDRGVCGRRSLLSLMAEMSSKTKPHCNAFQYDATATMHTTKDGNHRVKGGRTAMVKEWRRRVKMSLTAAAAEELEEIQVIVVDSWKYSCFPIGFLVWFFFLSFKTECPSVDDLINHGREWRSRRPIKAKTTATLTSVMRVLKRHGLTVEKTSIDHRLRPWNTQQQRWRLQFLTYCRRLQQTAKSAKKKKKGKQ